VGFFGCMLLCGGVLRGECFFWGSCRILGVLWSVFCGCFILRLFLSGCLRWGFVVLVFFVFFLFWGGVGWFVGGCGVLRGCDFFLLFFCRTWSFLFGHLSLWGDVSIFFVCFLFLGGVRWLLFCLGGVLVFTLEVVRRGF